MTDIIALALAEDIGGGDLTATAVLGNVAADAVVVAKQAGVVAGGGVAVEVFERVDPSLVLTVMADGERVAAGDELLTVSGSVASILTAERTALNFLGELSGIATLTARYVARVAGTGAVILDTRKTSPGMRALAKAAVRAGGGESHRAGLHDHLLVKENHIRAAGGVAEATRRALAGRPKGAWVEVEVTGLEELDEALAAGAERIMLDNMDLPESRAAVARTGGRALLEASGNVTLETVRAIAETGVDFISVGALTHSAAPLDVSLRLRG